MFQISDVSCRSGRHISHFPYTQPRGTTPVLLSQNADYLDGLQGILTGNEPYSGEIALNGRRYAVQRAAFMTRTFRMYREQTVIANVLTENSPLHVPDIRDGGKRRPCESGLIPG